jgi:flagellar hook-associated protein 3 FlgL
MRVNPNPLPDLLAELNQNQNQLNSDELQIASGQSVNLPSDNPAAAASLVRNADQTSRADQFLRSVGSVQGEMQSADSTLNSVVTALQRAISLGVEGANGTLSDTNRAAIAEEVKGIQSQLLNLANLSYQGNYVFAGTATQTTPYVLDVNAPSGVSYKGNSNTNQITLGNHFTLQANLPGSQLFSGSGTDMFQGIQDLLTSLQSGNTADIGSAVTEISNAYNHIGTQRVFYGNAENQLNSQQTYLNSEITQLATQQNSLGGADMVAVLSNLNTTQIAREATLSAMARIGQSNLFDYLK